jgi:hypothetical protein
MKNNANFLMINIGLSLLLLIFISITVYQLNKSSLAPDYSKAEDLVPEAAVSVDVEQERYDLPVLGLNISMTATIPIQHADVGSKNGTD